MSNDPNSKSAQDFFRWMCRHLVVLSAIVEYNDKWGTTEKQLLAFSGFVIIVRQQAFWVTAGHCFKDLHKLMDDPRVTISEFAFSDYFGLDAQNYHDLPFPYERGLEFAFYREEMADFALLPIPRLTCEAFVANGIKAAGRENWTCQTNLDFDFYRLLGVPKDFATLEQRSDGTYKRRFIPHGVLIRGLNKDEMQKFPLKGRLGGRIDSDAGIKDIAGMSGGPIFGFRKRENGEWSYFFCAAQSTWIPEKRIIYGCPLPFFGELMHTFLGDPDDGEENGIEGIQGHP